MSASHVDAEGRCQHLDWQNRLCGEVHDPARCQGHSKTGVRAGKQCGKSPTPGSTVCRNHGAGRGTPARQAADRRVEQSRLDRTVTQLVRELGESVDIRDGEALLAMRNMAAAKVMIYGRLVDELDPDSEWFLPLYHHSGEATGEWKPNIRIAAQDVERDRLARLDEICVKLGFDQRRLRIAEAELGWLFDAVTRAGAQVLTAEQQEAFRGALIVELRREPPALAG